MTQLATVNVVIGGIAILGWLALGLLPLAGQLPQDWSERWRLVPDFVFLSILLGGPACLVAGPAT